MWHQLSSLAVLVKGVILPLTWTSTDSGAHRYSVRLLEWDMCVLSEFVGVSTQTVRKAPKITLENTEKLP